VISLLKQSISSSVSQNLAAKILNITEKAVTLRQNIKDMKHFLISISLLLLFTACSKDDDKKDEPLPKGRRTVIVFMSADNSLENLTPEKIRAALAAAGIDASVNRAGTGLATLYKKTVR
jgi:hypothetical protein